MIGQRTFWTLSVLAKESDRPWSVANSPDVQIDALQEPHQARGPMLLRVAFAVRDLWNGSQHSGSCGTQHALYSNPFAFRAVWAAGEEKNVTSALPASV